MKFTPLVVAVCLVFFALNGRAADDLPLKRGTPAPDFTAYRADGTAAKLSDYRGQVVLIDFWATWCEPCRQAMPRMEALHQKLKNLVLLGVCVADEPKNFTAWMKSPKVPTTYPLLFDQARKSDSVVIGEAYHLSEIPTFYLIGKDGKVLFAAVGVSARNEANLDAALKSAGFAL